MLKGSIQSLQERQGIDVVIHLSLKMSSDKTTIVLDDSLEPSGIYYSLEGKKKFTNIEFNGFKGTHPLHGLVLTIHEAFSKHLTLELSPDDIWTLIVQGIGQHVARNPDKFRSQLVNHEKGKQIIDIHADDLQIGQTTSDQWINIVKQLKIKTLEHIPQNSIARKMVQIYSTSTEMHNFLYSAGILSTLQNFMSYTCTTLCGIPRIVLKGTIQDWQKLSKDLNDLNLSNFDEELIPWDEVLREIVNRLSHVRILTENDPFPSAEHIRFLKNIYKYNSESGGESVSGWILGMFPYLGNTTKHIHQIIEMLRPQVSLITDPPCVKCDMFPSGINNFPFVWKNLDHKLPMEMFVGFDTPEYDSDNTVRSRIGFAVCHTSKQ